MNREGGGEEKGRRRGLQNQWGFLAGNGSLSIINSSSCPPLATSPPSLPPSAPAPLPLLVIILVLLLLFAFLPLFLILLLVLLSIFPTLSPCPPLQPPFSSPLLPLLATPYLLFRICVPMVIFLTVFLGIWSPQQVYPSASIPILFFLFASTFYFSMNFFLFLTAFVSSPL